MLTKKLFQLFILYNICSCAVFTQDTVEEIQVKKIGKLFAQYTKLSATVNQFEDTLNGFFVPENMQLIEQSFGWSRFVYDSVFKVAKQGSCESIKIILLKNNKAQLDCVGQYKYLSPLMGSSLEDMELRVYFILIKERWYIEKSGFKHTHISDVYSKKKSYGLKF